MVQERIKIKDFKAFIEKNCILKKGGEMDKTLLEQINEKTDIVDLVSEFVDLSKRGKNYMGLCPFHQEKTPSFSVSPEKNIAKCMSCGEGGNPVNFYRKIKNITKIKPSKNSPERAGITIKKTIIKKDPHEKHYELMHEVSQFYQFNLANSKKGQEAFAYLYQRQMTMNKSNTSKSDMHHLLVMMFIECLKDKGFKQQI
jgi:DNA primase